MQEINLFNSLLLHINNIIKTCMRPMSQKLRLHPGPCGLVTPPSISYGRCLGFYPPQVGLLAIVKSYVCLSLSFTQRQASGKSVMIRGLLAIVKSYVCLSLSFTQRQASGKSVMILVSHSHSRFKFLADWLVTQQRDKHSDAWQHEWRTKSWLRSWGVELWESFHQ
jgi:hypothetical protein